MKFLRIIVIFHSILLLYSCDVLKLDNFTANNGIMDLRLADLQANKIYTLDGDWNFIWKEFISPTDLLDYKDNFELQQVPAPWNKGSFGYGTYSIKILIENTNQDLALYIPTIFHASKVWINGKLEHTSGIVGTNKKSMTPQERPRVINFTTKDNEIEIVLQVSNFVHSKGGIVENLYIGSKKAVLKHWIIPLSIEIFIIGALFMIGLHHLSVVFMANKKLSPLIFSIITILTAIHLLTSGQKFLTFIIPNISWVLYYKLHYLSTFLTMSLLALYVYLEFTKKENKILFWIILFLIILPLLLILIPPVTFFSKIVLFFQIILALCILTIVYITISSVVNKVKGSTIFLIGVSILFMTIINDILVYNNSIISIPLGIYGFFIFILSRSFYISHQSVDTIKKLQILTNTLEDKVNRRTIELSKSLEKLRKISRTDTLTGINNRRSLNDSLEDAINKFKRHNTSFSGIMFDIDHFKNVNDTYGHDVGDMVLVKISEIVSSYIRKIDIFARWGGEEFIIILPYTELEGVEVLANRIRTLISSTDFTPVGQITCSFGVTSFNNKDKVESFLKRIDNALYNAKKNGRDRVIGYK